MPSPRKDPISDREWQLFVHHCYNPPGSYRDLTTIQKRVRYVVQKWNGNLTAAAKDIGVTRQNIEGHISLIESKGWKV